jgi:hypothetical protein
VNESARARLSVQNALVGQMPATLLGACIAVEGDRVVLTW